MAWYNTGTIAVSGTTVTGTGTNWLDNKFAIGPGQALLIPGSGTVKMYEIKSVDSATKITLMTSPGTLAAGQAYSIMSFYTDSVPDFARRLAAQLSYYQTQMDGWQQIMTGSGSITLTAPDGTSVTVSSMAKLTTDIGNAVLATDYGMGSNINLTQTGFDVQNYNFLAGQHIVFYSNNFTNAPAGWPALPSTAYGCYIDVIGKSGSTIHMMLTLTSGSNTIWGLWHIYLSGANGSRTCTARKVMTDGTLVTQLTVQTDANTLTSNGSYYGQLTNGPAGNAYCILDVASTNNVGSVIRQECTATSANVKYTRTYASGAWGAWQTLYSSQSVIPLANGGTGGTTQATARTALGLGALSTFDAVNRGQLTGEAFRNLFASGGTASNSKGAGVWSFNNTPFAFNTQYGVCLQASNRSDALDTAGSNVWQHYLALGTNGEIVYAYNINSTYSARKVYTTGNTTTNSSGALVPASPVVRIVNQRDASIRPDILGTSNNEYKWVDECSLVNEESQGCSVSRTGVGSYLVKGASGLAKDLWTVMDCGNGQGRIIALAEAEETEDGIVVRCYKQKYSLSDDGDLTTDKGNQIDIPAESWIDIRLEMPSDSVYNQQQSEVARLQEIQQNTATTQQTDSSPDTQDDGSEEQTATTEPSQQLDEPQSESVPTDNDENDHPEI